MDTCTPSICATCSGEFHGKKKCQTAEVQHGIAFGLPHKYLPAQKYACLETISLLAMMRFKMRLQPQVRGTRFPTTPLLPTTNTCTLRPILAMWTSCTPSKHPLLMDSANPPCSWQWHGRHHEHFVQHANDGTPLQPHQNRAQPGHPLQHED
jgi:hypothetical protein